MYPVDGCEGKITFNTKAEIGEDGGNNVALSSGVVTKVLGLDFQHYNNVNQGGGALGKATVHEFRVKLKAGFKFHMSGIDVYGVTRNATVVGTGDWQTVVLNWELMQDLCMWSFASFMVDDMKLSCGNIINTCDDV